MESGSADDPGETLAGARTTVELTVRTTDPPSELGRGLLSVAHRVERASPRAVTLRRERGEPESLEVGAAGAWSVRYRAVPEGAEAPPFSLLLSLAAGTVDPARAVDVEGPVPIVVFIAEGCPHCPGAVKEAVRLAACCPAVELSVVDAQRFAGEAGSHGVSSVPATVIGGELVLTGVVSFEELVTSVLDMGSEAHGARLLASMLETGRMEDAVEMLRRPAGSVSFARLWSRSTMSDRLGLMMLVEEAREVGVGLGEHLLWRHLQAAEPALRGDTADVLGKVGTMRSVAALEACLDDPNEDVAEVAAEAIEEIRSRAP
jgi:hypothetical protein